MTRSIVATIAAGVLAACSGGSDASTTANPPTTGALHVAVSGLPDGVSADVAVSGRGASLPVRASTVLDGLAPGEWEVTAGEVTSAGILYVPVVTGSPATVVAGETAEAAVVYGAAGMLAVDVTGLPDGTNAPVVVTGPGGLRRYVTSSAVLEGLFPGRYQVDAPDLAIGPVVPSVYRASVAAAEVEVVAGALARSQVYFAKLPGTGRLWVSSYGSGTIDGITGEELAGGAAARVRITASYGVDGLAFDTSGNLWVTNAETHTASMYPASVLETSGSPLPVVTLTLSDGNGTALYIGTALAFDADGDLWVITSGNAVAEIAAADLAGSGNKTAKTLLSLPSYATDIAFDPDGNLWIADSYPGNVLRIPSTSLATSGSVSPDLTLTSGWNSVGGLAFDAAGNLLVGVYGYQSGSIYRYDAPNASGLPSHSMRWVDSPSRIALDHAGDLWILGYSWSDWNTELRSVPATAVAGGAGAPSPPISGISGQTRLAFDPPPPTLRPAR